MNKFSKFKNGSQVEAAAPGSFRPTLPPPPMSQKPVTMADIARHAGVSKATVSAVVNGKDSVGDETRVRVQAVIDHFNYRPRSAARLHGDAARPCIGYIIKEARNPYYAEALDGILSVAQAAGYLVEVASSEGDLERERAIVEQFTAQDISGLVITPILHEDADLSHLFELKRLNVPFVLVERVRGLQASLVDIDNVEAARAATRHLLADGHRAIVHFAGPPYSSHSEERARGVRLAFSESRRAFEDAGVVHAGDALEDGYRAALERFGEAGDRPTAVVCYNDLVALGVVRALRELGLRVPEDVSVMGFDDLDILDYLSPALSTVHVPKREMGERAARLLIEQIESRGHAQPERITLPVELKLRGSTAPPAEAASPTP